MLPVQLKESMKKIENIRNISVIAHVDHGKTTLVDSLLSLAGMISTESAGNKKAMMGERQEKERGITIKSSAISLLFNNKYVINLIDSPGHIDFSSEVSAALRITDGSLVVIDCIEGVCVQTETVLVQAIMEKIKPILFLNKLDRIFLEKQLTLNEAYKTLLNSIASINTIFGTYKMESITPESGNIGFGSALHSWGFTVKDFASFYSSLYGLSIKKMMKKLWGNNYFDKKLKKWVTLESTMMDQSRYLHGFCDLVLKPIKILNDSIMNKKKEIYEPIINMLQLNISKTELNEYSSKHLLKLAMSKWLPCGTTLLDMIVTHLPSPMIAQKYRIPSLYTGPLETDEAQSILNCNPTGSLSMYISKMIPNNGRFIAFGRIFSGCLKIGQEIRILTPNMDHNDNDDENKNNNNVKICKVQNLITMMGSKAININECHAGNLCGIIGIDQYLLKSGTITNDSNIYPFKTMKFSVSPVVKVAVNCLKSSDLPKLIEGLKKLSKSDPLIKITQSNQNEHIIACSGELHLETCIRDLREKFMSNSNASLSISNPIVSFRESVQGSILKYISTKTPNKLNHLYMNCEEITNKKLISDLENNKININIHNNNNKKIFIKLFKEKYPNYSSSTNPLKIWSFGSLPDSKANVLVDKTKQIAIYPDVKQNIINSFKSYSLNGVLCEENVYRIQYNLMDCKLHSDSVHRKQIFKAAKRCFSASQLACNPCLLEPMYLIDINVASNEKNGVFEVLNMYRAEIDSVLDKINIPITTIRAFIPILETLNKQKKKKSFTQTLSEKTHGKAMIQMRFSHWKQIGSDPLVLNTNAYEIMMQVRQRKGLKLEIPKFSDYFDKIH